MKRGVMLTGVFFISITTWAQFNRANRNQQSGDGSIMDKLYFSGGGGFGSGTGLNGRYKYFSLLPTIGYRAKPDVLIGMNISYSRYSYPDINISYDQYGFAPFVRYYFQQLFFQLEYDKISSIAVDNQVRKYYDRLLVGIGYKTPLGKRSALNVMGLYDLLYNQNIGVFASPFVFRVFVSF